MRKANNAVNARELDRGHRARIGIILPSSNVISEPDIARMLPPGVTLHTTRLRIGGGSHNEMRSMADQAVEAAGLLADAQVDIIAFHCTAVTMMDAALPARIKNSIEDRYGILSTSTADAVLGAFETLRTKRLTLITPYTAEVNNLEIAFLNSHGIEVVACSGMDITTPQGLVELTPDDVYRDTVALKFVETDAYFLSCTAIRASEVISIVERELLTPTVTSNQALAWECLRKTGITDKVGALGILFSNH